MGPPGTNPNIGANEVTVTGLIASNDSWNAATNDAARIQLAIASISTSTNQGGRVILPSGTFYVAQTSPAATIDPQINHPALPVHFVP